MSPDTAAHPHDVVRFRSSSVGHRGSGKIDAPECSRDGENFSKLLLSFSEQAAQCWITSPAFVVRYKVGETLAGLLEIRTFTAEKPVRGLRIAENRRLRLVQLVSQGGGQFAHGGHAVQLRDFIEAPAGAPV